MIISAISAIKRERNREHIYTQNIDKTHLTDLLVLVHRHHPFVGHFVVLFCLCFSPTRERDRERDREKGICSDESGIVEFLPEEKRSQKGRNFSKLLFLQMLLLQKFFLSLSLLCFVSKTSDFFFEFPYRRNHFQRRIRWLPSTGEGKIYYAGKARLYSSPTSSRARRRVRGSRTRLKRRSVETNPR